VQPCEASEPNQTILAKIFPRRTEIVQIKELAWPFDGLPQIWQNHGRDDCGNILELSPRYHHRPTL